MSTHQPLAQLLTTFFDRQHIVPGVGPRSFHSAEAPDEHAHLPFVHSTEVNGALFHVKKQRILDVALHNKARPIPTTIATTSASEPADFEEEIGVDPGAADAGLEAKTCLKTASGSAPDFEGVWVDPGAADATTDLEVKARFKMNGIAFFNTLLAIYDASVIGLQIKKIERLPSMAIQKQVQMSPAITNRGAVA